MPNDQIRIGLLGCGNVGGALMPPLQGRIIDLGDFAGNIDIGFMTITAVRASFVLPLICFVVIACYGFTTHRSRHD